MDEYYTFYRHGFEVRDFRTEQEAWEAAYAEASRRSKNVYNDGNCIYIDNPTAGYGDPRYITFYVEKTDLNKNKTKKCKVPAYIWK